ncbi:MAG: hypothetical protein AABY22_19960, partial [Nanoarchaeota archaeon]
SQNSNYVTARKNIVYDGKIHSYKATIPAGGLKIDKIKLADFMIPGELIVKRVKVFYSLIT